MRINSDLQSRINPRNAGVKTKDNQPKLRAQPNAERKAQVPFQGNDLRSASNALTIMHKAQVIVQQALNVSSRLQNIAMNNYSQGSRDMNQIGVEIGSINRSFDEFGADVSKPPLNRTIDPDEMRNDLNAMQGMAEQGTVDRTQINGIYSSMQERSYALDSQISTANRNYGIKSNPDPAQIADSVRTNPETALHAQNGIRPDSAQRLI